MLTAIFIVVVLILVTLLALAYMLYIFKTNYEDAELAKIKLINSIRKELSKTFKNED